MWTPPSLGTPGPRPRSGRVKLEGDGRDEFGRSTYSSVGVEGLTNRRTGGAPFYNKVSCLLYVRFGDFFLKSPDEHQGSGPSPSLSWGQWRCTISEVFTDDEKGLVDTTQSMDV